MLSKRYSKSSLNGNYSLLRYSSAIRLNTDKCLTVRQGTARFASLRARNVRIGAGTNYVWSLVGFAASKRSIRLYGLPGPRAGDQLGTKDLAVLVCRIQAAHESGRVIRRTSLADHRLTVGSVGNSL
jgi:hypothetical protein